jgi:hypothetical protein
VREDLLEEFGQSTELPLSKRFAAEAFKLASFGE